MRMKPTAVAQRRRVARKPTNVTLDPALVAEARRLDINLSEVFEERLRELVKERRAARWLRENKAALDGYARYVEAHGIWNEDEREW